MNIPRYMIIQAKNLPYIVLIVILLLLIPLFGNAFVIGWNWTFGDFIFAFIFLFIAGLVFDFTRRKFTKTLYRVIACIGVVLVFALIWAELAVGAIENIVEFLI